MIEIKNLTKNYDLKNIFDNFNLNIEDGKILAILGESGSGKTTLLNCIANLVKFSGQIINVPKNISYVFQHDRLIKNLTVEENLRLICGDIDVSSALNSVNLSGIEKQFPYSLSAGMSRRISILRAFLYNSKLLLMDEPFINLDISIKYDLIKMIKQFREKDLRTIVFVTHDIKEAVELSDRIIVLKNKNIAYDSCFKDENTQNKLINILLKKD